MNAPSKPTHFRDPATGKLIVIQYLPPGVADGARGITGGMTWRRGPPIVKCACSYHALDDQPVYESDDWEEF
jgi:hypothetical protein